jgi:uncharacterized RDD family membrane protein YckC
LALRYVSGKEVEHNYQTIIPRIGARIIDGLLFAPFWIIYLLLTSGEADRGYWFVIVANFVAYELYMVYLQGRYGQTLGKKITKVKVFDIGGGRLSYRQAFYREAISISSFLIENLFRLPAALDGGNPLEVKGVAQYANYAATGAFITDVLFVFTNNQRRAIHDFIASSVVVKLDASLSQVAQTDRQGGTID